jgi:hypothetical protein
LYGDVCAQFGVRGQFRGVGEFGVHIESGGDMAESRSQRVDTMLEERTEEVHIL